MTREGAARTGLHARLHGPALTVSAKHDRDFDGWLPLWRHMEDSAAVAGRLWDEWLPLSVRTLIATALPGGESDARRLVVWLASVHDIGKATPAFGRQAAPAPAPAAAGQPGHRHLRRPPRGHRPQLLRRTLTQGIGKAKAYGCGLLTLAPLGTTGARG
jgi:hypothetical protein